MTERAREVFMPSQRFSPQPLRSYPIPSLESSASTSMEPLSDYSYLDRRMDSPSLSGPLTHRPHSVQGDTIDFSGLISLHPGPLSSVYASSHSVNSVPHPTSHSPPFSLWDDSLVDSHRSVPYYPNLPDAPSSVFGAAFRRQPGGTNASDAASPKKSCVHCHVTSTPLWRRDPSTQKTLCNACGVYLQQRGRPRPQELIDADIDDDETLQIPDAEYTGPKCSHCSTRQTSVWRRSKTGAQVCNACGVYSRLRGKDRPLSLKRNKIRPRTKHQPEDL
ncbi:GATA zinc finger-domain-containing protein [Mycena albidolilacea]|uniref:GATA zinc finger-domain-containing protein n=1 Tax=Mycena albidolilacea TaxID=1033008 RepID=A0AAD7A7T2_9AGAR|nr:GATA zinc finger-domain-containing protein [Mycena albidolilacea]